MRDTVTLTPGEVDDLTCLFRMFDPSDFDDQLAERLRHICITLEASCKTRLITVICKEVGYNTDPLIYVVEITDQVTKEKVTKAVRDQRRHELSEDCEDVVQTLTPLFVFEGDLAAIADWRWE